MKTTLSLRLTAFALTSLPAMAATTLLPVIPIASLSLAAAPAQAAEKSIIPRYENGPLSVRAYGRLQGDALLSSGLPENRTESFDLRRARIGVAARYGKDWRARIAADVSDGTRLQEAQIEYRGWPVWIEAGRILEPFGLADQSSSRDLPFMERPQASVLGTSFGFGIAANARGALWALTAGLFGQSGNSELDGRDSAITARGTFTPVRSDTLLVHLGAGISQREPEGDTLRYSGAPESTLVSGLSVQSARLAGVKSVRLANGEAAIRRGPVLISAEYINAAVETQTGPQPSYGSYYVEGSWALTGERRDYSTRQGTFGGLKPKRSVMQGGIGAVEVAARYGSTDLTDPTLGGEKGRVAGVGINWTPVESLRVQLNALSIEEERKTATGTATEDDTVVQMRVQFSF